MALGKLKESEQFLKKSLQVCHKEKPACDQAAYQENFAYEGYFILGKLYIKKGDKKRATYHLNLFLQKVKKGIKIEKAKELLKEISSSSSN